ncbi:MAG: hypothetical protein ACRD9R_11270 [Pyrinomonadaceae bacterium]
MSPAGLKEKTPEEQDAQDDCDRNDNDFDQTHGFSSTSLVKGNLRNDLGCILSADKGACQRARVGQHPFG